MKNKPDRPLTPAGLRQQAEARLRGQGMDLRAKTNVPQPAADSRRLFHELQVHQVELELQNAELRQARDNLEEALENYTDLYDFAPVGYFTLAADGAIQLVNLTGASLVGIERSKLVGQCFGRLLATELRPVFNAFLRQIFASPVKQSADFELLRPGRLPQSVNIEAQRLVGRQECRAAMVDITGRKRAEEAVRVSEIRYRRLFEAAHDGVLLLDPVTCKITDANPFLTTLLGYPHDQLVGKELYEIGLLQDETASREMFQKLKRTHEVRYENLPLESQGGRRQQVEVVANLYQENGHAVIQCNIRDIAQRKHAEEILRRNEVLFSALIAQAPVGIYVVDARFQLQQVNPTARPAFKNVRPLIGRELSEVLQALWPRRIAQQIMERFRHTLKTGEPYQSPEFYERRRDTGMKEFYEWQIQRITLPAGEQGVVCFFNDLTARKRSEAAERRMEILGAANLKLRREIIRRQAVEVSLQQSKRHQTLLLEQSHEAQAQLRHLSRQVLRAQEEERKRISRELHDVIAQTLTTINVRLAALKQDAAVSTQGIDRSIARTQRMVEKSVNTVHEFARELRPAVLDDLGLIPALHSFVKSFSKRTRLHVHLKVFAGIEQVDNTRRTVLYRVAQEALSNVARHAQASRVEVNIQQLAGGICMKIKDDGKSFSVARVLDARDSKRIGLLGMRERLEMVGGCFEVESAPGQGTTVIALIPRGKAALRERGVPAASTSPTRAPRTRETKF